MRRDTAPTRRLTLVYPLPQRRLITLSPPPAIRRGAFSSPLLPLTSPFTVKVHANVSLYSSDKGQMSKKKRETGGRGNLTKTHFSLRNLRWERQLVPHEIADDLLRSDETYHYALAGDRQMMKQIGRAH